MADREQLQRWLAETEDDNESVIGDEDPDELEMDFVELHNHSREVQGHSDSEDDCDQVMDYLENDTEVQTHEEGGPEAGPSQDTQQGTLRVHFENAEFYLGKDRETRWYLEPQVPRTARTPRHNIIPVFHRPGPQGNARLAKTPEETILTMIDDEIISKIVEFTNIYIAKIRTNFERERDARPTDAREMKALIGILFIAGAVKAGRRNLSDLWDNTCGTGVELVYVSMSQNRFRFLIRCLRFDNIHTREERKSVDKFAAFREIFEKFVSNCKSSYKPTDYLTLDEQLVAFRGNCPFRVYIPNKPAKYGIKVYALVSTTNFYTTNLEVYVGTQPDGPHKVSNSCSDVVERLVEPVVGTNRNITCDNWFSSVPLVKKLREELKLTMIATLRKNKREVPPNFLPDSQREVQSSIFGFQKNCTLVSYVPKKNKAVLMISSMHNNVAIDEATGDQKKPVIISDYNDTKYGVDILDKMCRQYDASRNSKRWPLTLFFHILNVGGVNAMTIYKANNKITFVNRLNFLKEVSYALLKPQIQQRISLDMIPRHIRTRGELLLKPLEEGARQPQPQPQPQPQRTAVQGRCYLCGRARNKTSRKSCFKCNKWVCLDHLKSVCAECAD